MNSKTHSLIKTLTWRVTASTITFFLVYFISGEVRVASGVTVLEAITKMLAYYLHERAWVRFDARKQYGEEETK